MSLHVKLDCAAILFPQWDGGNCGLDQGGAGNGASGKLGIRRVARAANLDFHHARSALAVLDNFPCQHPAQLLQPGQYFFVVRRSAPVGRLASLSSFMPHGSSKKRGEEKVRTA